MQLHIIMISSEIKELLARLSILTGKMIISSCHLILIRLQAPTNLTISFWTFGKFESLENSTLFESGSALGRHLNVHFPWSNSRFYWDAGMSDQYDRIEKEDEGYLG